MEQKKFAAEHFANANVPSCTSGPLGRARDFSELSLTVRQQLHEPQIAEPNDKIRGLMAVHVPPRHPENLLCSRQAQKSLFHRMRRMDNTELPARCEHLVQRSTAEYISGFRAMENHALEADEHSVLDERIRFRPAQDIASGDPETIDDLILWQKPGVWKPVFVCADVHKPHMVSDLFPYCKHGSDDPRDCPRPTAQRCAAEPQDSKAPPISAVDITFTILYFILFKGKNNGRY
jgi:hypothetical protein